MSYQVLARKWRPGTFADMVGQEHVLRALTSALDNDRLHAAYLFTGTRGVGKTTLARIIAKCLNCEQGVSATPCNKCSACTSISEGHFIDLIEVDAASRAKVDETRELMDNVQYAPSVGRYKVYLIDEIHMFSGHSFNALLKTLEEPPSHVKFLLATTESKKIPVTILSRCLQFNLKHLSVTQIEQHLENILQHEGIESDVASRRLIAKSADGSLRDALSLLDHAIVYGDGRLQEEQVRAMIGTIDHVNLLELLNALVSEQPKAVLQCIDSISEYNPDYDLILVELLSIFQKIAICQLVDDEIETSVEISKLAQQISKEDVQLYYQIAIKGRQDLPSAPDPQMGFQMTLIRMLAFKPAQPSAPAAPELGHNKASSGGQHHHAQAANKVTASNGNLDNEEWQSIIDTLPLTGLTKDLVKYCVLKEHTADKIHLILSPDRGGLMNDTQKQYLTDALTAHFGADIKLKITVADPICSTPAEQQIQRQREKQQCAEQSLKTDENIQMLQQTFGATIDEKSIAPRTDDS